MTPDPAIRPAYVSVSRGARTPSYFVMTPANHFPSRLPFFEQTTVRKLVTPRSGTARFGQYLLELEPGARTTRAVGHDFEHFLYVLDGAVALNDQGLRAGSFAYVPEGDGLTLRSGDADRCRLLWIKRRYEPCAPLTPPTAFVGHRDDVPRTVTSVPGLLRQECIPPDDPAHDFNISIMAFAPGTIFTKVEVHDEEHGLYMTAGHGIYHLAGDAIEVEQDDFIYMAPYCPQYYYAIGPDPSEYLLYKDVFRDGF